MSEQAKAELTQQQQAQADQMAADVLRRVKGHDETARSQAKYMAFHKCNSAGMRPEVRDAFLELVRDLLERAMGNRAGQSETDQPPAIRSEEEAGGDRR